jgi:serine/threonine-protein kinase
VVHRDVKPDNILVNAFTGHALLTDFGIAHQRLTRIPYGSLGGATAAPGPIVGTAAFMSPEQASGGVVDGRSDIYSLGVVAYYALSGRLPLEAATDEALLALHINAQPRPLGDIAPSVPPRLAQVIDRCLAKQPWERFPDAAALVSAVTEAVGIPPAPLAVRAFLVRSTHLEAPALIHVAITGLGLLPAMVAAWVSPTHAMVRAMATLAFSIALLTPVIVTVARVRRLLAAGHRREELVTALGVRQARRREELAFVYGAGPTSFERSMAWVGRLALLMTAIAVSCTVGPLPVSEALVPYLWQISIGAGLTALLASMVSRARTEQRTDLIGERTLRFWRGPLGKAVFRIAALRLPTMVPRVTALDHLETPA